MRRSAMCLLIGLTAAASSPSGAADVAVSIDIGHPGFYGRIDIGRFPQPPVVYPQPVLVAPDPVPRYRQPIYLRVPPGHMKHWDRHCARYAACGQQTYFVDDGWYQTVYAPQVIYVTPRHRPALPHWEPRGRGHGHKDGRGGSRKHRRDD